MKKINIIDVIIVVIVILFVVCGVYKIWFKEKPVPIKTETEVNAGGEIIKENVLSEVRFRIRNIRNFSADEIQEGVVCYYTNGKKAGTLKNVSKEKYYEYALNKQNQYVKCEYSDKYTIYFDMILEGHHTRSAFNGVDWVPVGVGTVQYYEIGGICFECEVMKVAPDF